MIQRDRIIAAACDGKRPAVIATEIGAPRATVYSVICAARRAGHPIPYFETGRLRPEHGPTAAPQELRFNIDQDLARTLQKEAARRGIPPSRLARLIVMAVCEDCIFDAVLDP